jgi:hypothetical protein
MREGSRSGDKDVNPSSPAATARSPSRSNAPPTPRSDPQVACVMANVGQSFVMKATCASKPVRIAVTKP